MANVFDTFTPAEPAVNIPLGGGGSVGDTSLKRPTWEAVKSALGGFFTQKDFGVAGYQTTDTAASTAAFFPSAVELVPSNRGFLNTALAAEITADATRLAQDPNNTALRTQILQKQVRLTAGQLGVNEKQAGSVVRSYTAAYAHSNGIDPKAMIEALTAEEQRVLNYSANEPTLFGVDAVTANKIAVALAGGSGIFLTASIIAFVIAMFTLGPEIAAAAAGAEGVVATIGSVLGNPVVATGGFLFLISQLLGHFSSLIPMVTKQMIDNGSIGPGLRIKALVDAQAVIDKLSGIKNAGTGASYTPYSLTPKTRITMTKTTKPVLAIGVLFSSIVKRTDAFDRKKDDMITDKSDLQTDAQANLNLWLKSLPGRLIYTIGIQNNPYDENGVVTTGTWCVLNLGIKGIGGRFSPVDTILLGPIDPKTYYPTTQDVQQVQTEIPKLLTAEEVAQIEAPNIGTHIVDKVGNVSPDVFAPRAVAGAPSSPAFAYTPTTPGASPSQPIATSTPGAVYSPPVPAAAGVPYVMPSAPQPVPAIQSGGKTLITQEDYSEAGLATPPGAPSRAAYAAHPEAYRIFVTATPSAAPASAPAGPVANNPLGFLTISDGFPPTLYRVNTPGSVLHGRGQPNLNAFVEHTFKDRELVYVQRYAGENSGYHWYEVYQGSISTFVSGEFLAKV